MLDEKELIDYEAAAMIWPSFIWWNWGQHIVAHLLVRKVERKLKRYDAMKEQIEAMEIHIASKMESCNG